MARHLPEQLGTLLDGERFGAARAALARLAASGGAERAAVGIRAAEAGRLADLLLERWASVASVIVDPGAVVVGPDTVWVTDKPRAVEFGVATIGLADGWTAEWSNGAPVVEVPVPVDEDDLEVRVTVRVFGRHQGRRRVVVGEKFVRVRRPFVRFDPGGTRLQVTDQLRRPATATEVAVGETHYRTDDQGIVDVGIPVEHDAAVFVDGQRVSPAVTSDWSGASTAHHPRKESE